MEFQVPQSTIKGVLLILPRELYSFWTEPVRLDILRLVNKKTGASMRRKDREMSEDFGRQVIDRADYGVLAVTDPNGLPYALPLSVARDGDRLYFHSAQAGTKVDYLNGGKEVAVVFVSEVRVPELFSTEELQQLAQDPDAAGKLGSKVFTTEFASAIARGKARMLIDDEEKLHGLKVICQKFTPGKMDLFDLAANGALKITAVYEVRIESLTAKRKKFDPSGKEMKFKRMQ